jgi:pilus assembly protein Flp/PilA
MRNLISTFVSDESGATAIEYGLIAALVSVAAIGALSAMGTSLQTIFNTVKGELDKAKTTATTGAG